MPYCPSCRSEYQPGVERCAECDVALVESLPDDEPAELVEVFRAETRASAERVCAVILDGIECFVRERGSRAFPSVSMSAGLLFIAVPTDQADRAWQLLDEAVEDGAVTASDGEVLEPEES
jgi:hypothetical protein